MITIEIETITFTLKQKWKQIVNKFPDIKIITKSHVCYR